MLKKIFLFFFTLSFLIVTAGASTLYYLIAVQPSKDVELESIKQILGKESNVYYSDGVTRLGVFFKQTHRQYVEYKDIPESFVHALVAAEDDRFFEHFGFDPYGIARAIVANVRAGRVVQGGSTLTQQTAKNLFKRKDRSLKEKLRELLFALRLEYRYSKEQIFEFYSNQFYVSGNGHGLGIAAQFYFNKKPSELSLVESAFIAGSVKRPNYYNPFTKKTPESIARAKDHANTRLQYVLGKMKKLGFISDYEYTVALHKGVPFNKGQFGYELDYTMELVRDAISQPFIEKALAEFGINNVSTSGVSIITSIDKNIQDKALYAMRRQLSELDVRLRGYEREEVQLELQELTYKGDLEIAKDAFVFGHIENISGLDKDLKVDVDFGGRLGRGVLDEQGIKRLTAARTQWTTSRWATPKAKDRKSILKQLQVGDKLWVSVREIDQYGIPLLDLEKYPKIQGGALVMKQGAIQAVIGGTENRFLNRAIYSKRTMGSSFKPFVYTAALQLGWNSADALDNMRNLFSFQAQAYFPRPDHISPYNWVSMTWAGIKSENLASIWLLYHLTDQLDQIQFTDLAKHLGFTPKTVDGKTEPYSSYKRRIRDNYGLLITNDSLREAAYTKAVKNVETDFLFDGMVDEYTILKELDYGLNFTRYKKELTLQKKDAQAKRRKLGKSLTSRQRNEFQLRSKLLSKSFINAKSLRNDLLKYRKTFEWDYDFFAPTTATTATTYSQEDGTPYLYKSTTNNKYYFGYNFSGNEKYQFIPKATLQEHLSSMTVSQQNSFWSSVHLGETISLAALNMVENQMSTEYQKLKAKSPYDFDTLSSIRDFRVTVGLHYLIALAKEMGIESKLAPVLSFPLGSNVVTLLESVRYYEAMITGKRWKYSTPDIALNEEEAEEEIAIIDRIETQSGKVLYQAQAHGETVVDPQTSLAISDILENVVKYGTGRGAKKAVKLNSEDPEIQKELDALKLEVPLLGKTGTANNYTNAAFLGYLPGFDKEKNQFTLSSGYTVGVYVGFDDNKPMEHQSIRIAGAGGALAPWSAIVNQLIDTQKYVENLDIVDLSFDGVRLHKPQLGQVTLAMDTKNGGLPTQPIRQTTENHPSITTFSSKAAQNDLKLARYYRPFWKAKTLTTQ